VQTGADTAAAIPVEVGLAVTEVREEVTVVEEAAETAGWRRQLISTWGSFDDTTTYTLCRRAGFGDLQQVSGATAGVSNTFWVIFQNQSLE
jgi:hypothetical protein